MSTEPLVSVCVVSYNQAGFIDRCLQSVVAQLPPGELEVLVGDDGSSDDTRARIEEFARAHPGTIVPVFHPSNLGPSGNYRALIARARGRYIAHLDADDFWLPGKLRSQLATLQARPGCSASVGNALVVDPAGSAIALFTRCARRELDLAFLVEQGNFVCHASLLYHARHRERILAIEGPFVDLQILLRLAAAGPIDYTPELLAGYTWGAPTSMRARFPRAVLEGTWKAIRDSVALGANRATEGCAIATFARSVVIAALAAREPGQALHWLRRIRAESPRSGPLPILRGLLGVPWTLLQRLRRRLAFGRFDRGSVLYRR